MDKEPKTLLDLTSEQIEELDRIKEESPMKLSQEAWMTPEVMARETVEILETSSNPIALIAANIIRREFSI